MASPAYEQIIELAEQLTEEERINLIQHLQEKAKTQPLTKEEMRTLLESMVVDLGTISPDYSFRREDWYNDEGR